MTDRVDLDALDVDDEDGTEEPGRGDWFWHGEGRSGDGPSDGGASGIESPDAGRPSAADEDAGAPPSGTGRIDEPDAGAETTTGEGRGTRVPHVPRENQDKPVGVPVEGGGAGGASARAAAERDRADDPAGDVATAEDTRAVADAEREAAAASDMTMAFTYDAVQRLDSPVLAFADAQQWTDWIGIVGDVDAYVINGFVREEGVDIDFFNGAGTDPDERLREIRTNPNSMFLADRMVVVGTEADRGIARRADWEFVSIDDAAEGAGWDLD
ncbi:hypothetical protein BRD01_04185 [Halobacteriales archaeon QS_8_65_32]|nr:MAG: hypothetical protein BRD01_04185 [Halobacteriales archaeon QS_8_65_32]